MNTIETLLDEWEVKDLEDGSRFRVTVEYRSEMGNRSQPGLLVQCMGRYVNYEPCHVERWAYEASKLEQSVFVLQNESWLYHNDQFVRFSLVIDKVLKARVEVKLKSKKQPIVKDYELPFKLED